MFPSAFAFGKISIDEISVHRNFVPRKEALEVIFESLNIQVGTRHVVRSREDLSFLCFVAVINVNVALGRTSCASTFAESKRERANELISYQPGVYFFDSRTSGYFLLDVFDRLAQCTDVVKVFCEDQFSEGQFCEGHSYDCSSISTYRNPNWNSSLQ